MRSARSWYIPYMRSIKISVVAHPNARKPRIEKDLLGTLHVYVAEPPLEGKANKAITEALSLHFHVPKRNIVLASGEKSKHKVFIIIKI